MQKIKVLDEITANKIAAGEVVERPASVVKELLENALDAGSTSVRVEIEDGGTASIRIIDNGSGIMPGDVPLAFQRHATSKITDADDLERIATLGFRGEALPSIASVAKVSLSTRTADETAGVYIEISGGRQTELKPAGCPVGTDITVKDLFFNTPARKKHLKSINVETGHISDIIGRLALVNAHVSFTLAHNGKIVLQTPGTGNTIDAFAAIYGTETAKELIKLSYKDDLIEIEGYVAKPVVSRSNRNHQSLFINGRYIRSRLLSDAIEEGYHTLMNIGRHPLVVLNFLLNPELVDVNVHPTKMEVRFSQSETIRETVARAVRETLLCDKLIPEVKTPLKPKPEKIKYIQEKMPVIKTPQVREENKKSYMEPQIESFAEAEPEEVIREEACDKEPENAGPPEKADNTEKIILPYMEPVAQIDATYIVAQGESGMYLIDQHAAHERILYEKFMARQTEIASQELLVPVTIELTNLETQMMVNNIILFTDLGFRIEHFGGNTFLIRAVPQLLPGKNEKDFFLDLLDVLSTEKKKLTANEIKEKILITMACKAAIKANHALTIREMQEIIDLLQNTDNPYSCPHGRPTIIHMSGYELEKKFKRVM